MNPTLTKEAFNPRNWQTGYSPKLKPIGYSCYDLSGQPLALCKPYSHCINAIKTKILPQYRNLIKIKPIFKTK